VRSRLPGGALRPVRSLGPRRRPRRGPRVAPLARGTHERARRLHRRPDRQGLPQGRRHVRGRGPHSPPGPPGRAGPTHPPTPRGRTPRPPSEPLRPTVRNASVPAPPTAPRTLPAPRPRIGLLGIMQPLYDDMIPGITEHQAGYAARVAEKLSDTAEWTVAPPIRGREQAEQAVGEFEDVRFDAVLVVMLTYGPSMRVTRALTQTRLPVALANIQPDPEVTAAWDMDDMTYNQGIHGAQDTANAMVRAGRPFEVITGEWQSPEFAERFDRWARAARAVTAWRRLRVGVFGYPMNGMGDARVDETALLRSLGPEVEVIAPGALHRTMAELSSEEVSALMKWEDENFEVDQRLSKEEREDHARMQLGIERLLVQHGCEAYSTHFDAIGEDGRFARLPMAAASTLMAQGYGFAGEGDVLAAAIVHAGHQLAGDGHFTEMYAMDFPSDSILMSHMGEGN